MRKKKVNKLRGRPYNKAEEKYGTAEDLLNWSKETVNKQDSKRLLAIRMVMLEGDRIGFNGISRLNGVTVRTLHKWVNKWNKGGREELKRKPGSGRPRKFQKEHSDTVIELIKKQDKEKKRLTIKGVHNFLKEPV